MIIKTLIGILLILSGSALLHDAAHENDPKPQEEITVVMTQTNTNSN